MYKIQLNPTGTHFLDITDDHLNTIRKYALFRDLIDSNGYVDESVLNKLKLNVRSIIGSSTEDVRDLLHLAADVIYNDRMKAFGLRQLIILFVQWSSEAKNKEAEETTPAPEN
jgi:peptide subunit release factor RF-3